MGVKSFFRNLRDKKWAKFEAEYPIPEKPEIPPFHQWKVELNPQLRPLALETVIQDKIYEAHELQIKNGVARFIRIVDYRFHDWFHDGYGYSSVRFWGTRGEWVPVREYEEEIGVAALVFKRIK